MKNIAQNKTQMVLLGVFAISLVGFFVSQKGKYRNFFGATDTNQSNGFEAEATNPYVPYNSF